MWKQILVLLGVGMLGVLGWADVIYVNGSADGANDGANWADAYTDIQVALGVAQSGDEIWVAAGIYKPTEDTDRTVSFMMRDGVSLYGGFAGGETSLDQRDWIANETILSGDIGVLDDNSDNSYHVVMGANDASLNGFTITGGNANGGSWESHGGGMHNYQCSPTVSNCSFIGNSANTYGGGIANLYSSATVTDCSFSNNNSNNEGGGMSNVWGPSNPVVTNCSFNRNTATQNGGGLHNRQCSPIMTNCRFNGNTAGNFGGAVCDYDSTLTQSNNCIFIGNSAMYGGGIYHGRTKMSKLVNCSFSCNTASHNGGGVYNDSCSTSLTNCILWENTANNGYQIYNYNSSVSVSHSDIQGGLMENGNIDADPLFVRPPDDGGDGWGVGDNDDFGDLHLQYGSPCIDAGAEVDLDTDIEGNARLFDFPYVDNNGDLLDFDMGAYECITIPDYAITVLSPDGGELLIQGTIHTIAWSISHDMPVETVIIEFSTDGGENWGTIDTVENTGSYEWALPTVNSDQCLIHVSDPLNPSISDTSDSVFTIFECDPPIHGDVNGDCYVNMGDAAIVALNWLKCGNPFDPMCEE